MDDPVERQAGRAGYRGDLAVRPVGRVERRADRVERPVGRVEPPADRVEPLDDQAARQGDPAAKRQEVVPGGAVADVRPGR